MRKGITSARLGLYQLKTIVLSGLSVGLLLMFAVAVSAQKARNTDYSPDKSLKSNARVNPSTLAMELSIPIAGYTGRAGNGLPVAFNYSSKVWEMKTTGIWQGNVIDTKTGVTPTFAERSLSGWTSTLGTPRIDYEYDVYRGNDQYATYEGQIFKPAPWESYSTTPLYYIKRLRVQMPDGSTHEFRAGDTPINCGDTDNNCGLPDLTGTFLSVDGSRMRLESGSTASTLYLPDGSRYIFGGNPGGTGGALAHTFIDVSGNKMTYSSANKQWTDTLGRVIADPMPINWSGSQTQSTGIIEKSFPGFGTGTMDVDFTWNYLKDPNGSLFNLSDIYCQGNIEHNATGSHLFDNGTPTDIYVRICGPGYSTQGPGFNPVVLTEIKLPNGQSYQFTYNDYGEIAKIIYPTGAYERFVYQQIKPVQNAGDAYNKANRGVKDRYVSEKGDGTDEIHWEYTADGGTNPSTDPYKVTVTAPDKTYTQQLIHNESDPTATTPYGFGNAKTGMPYEDRTYAPGNPDTLLRRSLTFYKVTGPLSGGNLSATRDVRPEKQISIIFEPGNSYALAQMSETVYETPGSNGAPTDAAYFAAQNVKQTKTYHYVAINAADAQPSTLAAEAEFNRIVDLLFSKQVANITEVDYLYDSNYLARNISGLATETRIKDASGNVKAKSQISYDESIYALSSTGTMPTTAANSWVDLTQPGELGATIGSKRGLPTTVKSYSDTVNNPSLYIEAHSYYDQFGNLRKTKDGNNNESTVEYDDDYAFAYPTKSISPIPGNGTNGSNAAFVTTTGYDYKTGLPVWVKDANGQTNTLTTQMEYNDALLRPTKVITPNGHQSITEYGAGTNSTNRFVKVKTQIDDTKWKEGYSSYDGLGRTIKTQSVDSAGDVFTETQYDNLGRVKKVSNPYRANETVYWTENFYDDLGRVIKVKSPDNAEVLTAYGLSTTGSVGTIVTATDQASKQRRSITNALGQLKRVDEPTSAGLGAITSPNQPTVYSYDTLSNLTTVQQDGAGTEQCGGASNSTCAQTRSFTYDSLSRLKSATNPESGQISYTYDNNGNLTSKTDARGVVTSYSYDALNRVISRSYANEPAGQTATPTVNYYYDNLTNAKGKLIKVSSTISTTQYTSFDVMGRVTGHKQTTDGTDYTTAYAYNLSGGLIEETYPSTRKVKNVLDADGDLSVVQSKKTGNGAYFDYAQNFTYTAAGAVSSMQLGNGKWESTVFNSRLQPTQIALGNYQNGTDKLKLNFAYNTSGQNDNNGNVLSQTITVPAIDSNPAFVAIETYTYDSLNRIKSADEKISSAQQWKQTFTYDRYGNRRFDTNNNNTTTLATNCQTAVCNPEVNAANNKLVGYTFDNAGNTKIDAESKQFIYDAENKQTEVKDAYGASIGQYFYDGDGKRVKKYVPGTGETTVFVYDASGKMVAEYSTVVASTTDAKVSYLTADHLGSPRINTDKYGDAISRHDYQPFGEEISVNRGGYSNDDVRKKFTSYERDIETDLDFAQARMYASKLGRFSSPDDFLNDTKSSDPESWNLYTYVKNNPLKFTDPLGEKVEVDIKRKNKKKKTGTITLSASFSIYGEGVANNPEIKEGFKNYVEERLKETYGVKYKAKDGYTYDIVVNVTFDTAENKKKAEESGADNIVELRTDMLSVEKGGVYSPAGAATYRLDSENFDRVAFRVTSAQIFSSIFDHEFTHLLGLDTHSLNENDMAYVKRLNSNNNLTQADKNALFGDQIQKMGRAMESHSTRRASLVNEKRIKWQSN